MGLCAALAFAAPGAAKSIKKVIFPSAPNDALIVVEERQGMYGGSLEFVRVDLEQLTRDKKILYVSKAMDGRLRTEIPELQTTGEGLMIPKTMSRFSAASTPAGDYALVGFSFSMLVYQGYSCAEHGAPVFRIKAGTANMISAEMLPSGGGSYSFFKFNPARGGASDDLVDAQRIIDGYPNLKAKLAYAEPIGFVKFQDKKGRIDGCGKGETVVPMEMKR